MARVLVIDDDADFGREVAHGLRSMAGEIRVETDPRRALECADDFRPDVVVTDLMMPHMTGIELARQLKQRVPDTEIVLVTGFASMETAVEAFREGVCDFVLKPVNLADLRYRVQRICQHKRLTAEVTRLRQYVAGLSRAAKLIGDSPAMTHLRTLIERIAPVQSPLLILGETGTGKEVVARAVHDAGPNRDEPFVAVNCAAIQPSLLESELFGHRKGAFTGATDDRAGLMMAAGKGIFFLDEVGEMPLELQPKLLRVLEQREVRAVGAKHAEPIGARFIFATNRDLAGRVKAGEFREDLYYRMCVVEVAIPPLRERPTDIAPLAGHFLAQLAPEINPTVDGIEPAAMAVLENWHWPGNIRELRNTIERALIFCHGAQISLAQLPAHMQSAALPPLPSPLDEPSTASAPQVLKAAVRGFEQAFIKRALAAANGDRERAATALGISLATLYRKLGAP